MYRLKWFYKIFHLFSLKKIFLFTLICFFVFAVSSTIFVDAQSTTTPAPIQSYKPCSLFDQASWGYTEDGAGLFKKGGNGKTASAKYNFGEDPLFLTTNYNALDFDAKGGTEDPVLGFNGIDPVKEAVKVPCMASGSISGIIPRRGAKPPDERGLNASNCNYDVNDAGENWSMMILCGEDNKLNGKVTGGCPLNIEYKSEKETSNTSIVPYINVKSGGNKAKIGTATGHTYLRVIYSPGTQLQKTDSTGDNFYSDTLTSIDNYTNTIAFQRGSHLKPTGSALNLTFKFSDTGKIDTTSLPNIPVKKFYFDQDMKLNNGIGHIDLQNLGLWIKVDAETGKFNNGDTVNSEDLFINSVAEITNRIDSFYYVPSTSVLGKSFSSYLAEAPMVCSARTVDIINSSDGSKTGSSIRMYEWIPSINILNSIPTCGYVGNRANPGSANPMSQVVTYPSAIKINGVSVRYQVCSPCIVPKLFQSDMFNQPVIGIATAIGCLPSSLNGLITALLRIAVMTAGGIVVLIITISGLRIMLNTGNPDEIRKAQKGINSAVVGLLVIISSVLLLNIIGVKVLGLDTFGDNEINYITTGDK